MENFDSLIFDLDGTLWDANDTYREAWNEVLETYNSNLHISADAMAKVMGYEQKQAWNSLFPQLPDEVWRPWAAEIDILQVKKASQKGGKIYDKVPETLEALKKKYRLFLVSNCPEGLIPGFFAFSNLGRWFDDYEEHGRTKLSKSDNIAHVISRNALQKPVYIGDTEGDRKSAAKAGIPFIHATYGTGTLSAPAFATLSQISDLIELLM